jgi:hypothetical protein
MTIRATVSGNILSSLFRLRGVHADLSVSSLAVTLSKVSLKGPDAPGTWALGTRVVVWFSARFYSLF